MLHTYLPNLQISLLQPQNEQGPVFQGAPYSASIMEDHATGDPIGVTAVARDLIEGHSVEYRIDPSSQDGAYFQIGVTSGEITLGLSLDADPPNGHSLFTFNVRHSDKKLLSLFTPPPSPHPQTGDC